MENIKPKDWEPSASRYYFRFTLGQRYLHGLVIVTFLGLAATGMTLRFSDTLWAKDFATGIGGFRTVLFLHKFCALLITAGFLLHLCEVLYRGLVMGERGMFWGANSLVPQPKDLVDIYRHFKWFFWLGPKPRFDRYTYWEKFDYWAVFWGMVIIGVSGYMLWFTAFFARFVPGYLFNVALLVHGEEALLAVWFIFIIHFFNTHLRPEKFPMDSVIFTGRLSGEELRHERPLEYQRLAERHELERIEADEPPRWLDNFARIIAVVAVGTGFFLLALTLAAYFAGM
jgi:cytochrome b subunit of formate dehydrogenase